MRTIGMVGGLSWESSIEYYRIFNEESNKILGEDRTGKSILYTVDLHEMIGHMERGEHEILSGKLANACQALESAGAQGVLLCTNTMHAFAEKIQTEISVPLLHIADAVADEILRQGLKTVGLIGTPFTMDMPFYKGHLQEKYGIRVVTPGKSEYGSIYRVITDELTFGVLREESRRYYQSVIEDLKRAGAEGVILGCTEIPLLIKQKDVDIPVIDSTDAHAKAAVRWALED